MKLLWTQSSKPISKLIRWLFNEPSSHLVIEFDDRVCYHSNLIGVHLQWSSTLRSSNIIVHERKLNLTLDQEEKIYLRAIQLEGSPWDFAAGFYLFWRGLLYKLFKIAIPKYNKWGKPRAYLCHEMIYIFQDIVKLPVGLDSYTPERMFILCEEILKDFYCTD